MLRLDGLQNLSAELPAPVVAVGTFDGFHLGHRRVVDEVVAWAKELRGTPLVVTFEQPPRAFLDDRHPLLITSVPHRLRLLERAGVAVCVVLEFTRELAATGALEFARTVLVDGLHAAGVVMGPGSAFGRNREGTQTFLRTHAAGLRLEVRGVDEVHVDGQPVSSTRIRTAVARGDFTLAARLLGRPFSVFGTVVHGEGRGRGLGFPTANLDLHHEIIPPDGVYVARAVLDDLEQPALVSIGSQPTFTHAREGEAVPRVVELYLIDFDGQLYGQDVEAQFLERLRGQERFDEVAALVSRMEGDLAAARRFFATERGRARKNRPETRPESA
ncbi:MAG TPA: riboflavin biosynthesis protein RibF [Planctomycetota bacterium]|nr:riboflavin biosynthesis protein RibF [Planctomycetota bacterium]HUV40011.1 riboflavin biosynthesis protein RibF [Planctomycetota bacterium]